MVGLLLRQIPYIQQVAGQLFFSPTTALRLDSNLKIPEPGLAAHLWRGMNDDLPLITRSQLALRNGQDRPEVWVAFQGVVYDVSRSRLWRNGMHYEHWAGQDLTDEIADAPHTENVFDKFKPVARLA